MNDLANSFLRPAVEMAPKLPGAILNILVGYLVIKIAMFFIRRFVKILRTTAAVKALLTKIIEAVLWAMLVIYIMNYLGLGSMVVAITGSAVLIGFILNNGLSQAVSDIFASIELSKDSDFKVGTKISTNEDKIIGEIISMNLRKVKLLDDKGRLHVVPNSIFDKNEYIVLEKKDESHKSKK